MWAVVAIDDDNFLTGQHNLPKHIVRFFNIKLGSADKTIRHWTQHKLIHTYNGHSDAVRGLVAVPDIGFASCSNDRYADED